MAAQIGPGPVMVRRELSRVFGARTIARGEAYALEGRVDDVEFDTDQQVLTASCIGSHGDYYDVEIGFVGHDGAYEIEYALCSCPVGDFCKHAVAVLLTATPATAAQAPSERWRVVLGSLLQETAEPLDRGGRPIALEFSMLAADRYRPACSVALRPLTIGKRGSWIKTGITWRQLYESPVPGDFDSAQFAAMRALVRSVSGYYPYGNDTVVLSGVPRSFWSQLDTAIEAGVAVVAGTATGVKAVEFIKYAHLRLDFTADDATGGALMAAQLVVDGEQRDPIGVGLVGGPTPHGMHQLVDDGVLQLGPFDPVPGRTLLELIGHNEHVRIPAEVAAEFSAEVLPRLSRAVEVEVEEGLFTPPTIVGPLPVLTVHVNDGGARVFWSTRYEVNDQRHDFDPASATGPAGYRDAEAEASLWEAMEPALRLVAGVVHDWKSQALQHLRQRIVSRALAGDLQELTDVGDGSDTVAAASLTTLRSALDIKPVEVALLCHEVLPQLAQFPDLVVDIDEPGTGFRAAGVDPQLTFGRGNDDGNDDGDDAPVTDWFDLEITVDVEGYRVALVDVITELASGATHMLLPNGVYFRLDNPELVRLRELIEEARALGEIDGDRVNAASLNVTLWDELLGLGVVDQQLARWRANMSRLASAQPPVPVPVPGGLRADLREYQRAGLDWLSFLWDNGLGGVLADDMGLGKTVQTLALITRAVADGAGKFLVVAPTSVAANWVAECAKFAPDLHAVAITSTDARGGVPIAEQVAGADIVVTTYTLLRIDFDVYSQIPWAGMILDEAQFVKNHHSKTHQCVRRLDVPFKLAITGTPMENHLMELWALLSVTAPGLFPSPKIFENYFRKPIESGHTAERLQVLRRRIKPVMLRRTKAQVAEDLPPKHEQVLAIELGVRHRKVYDTRLARERQKVLGLLGDWEKNRFQIFRSLTLLRQLSLHPGLVDKSALDAGSAKVDFIVEQLGQLIAEGHSALVFSQFTGFLHILRAHLDAAGVRYSYLDGTVKARDRTAAIKAFEAGTNQVFLISLKAGGFGLNLTAADFCFVCDPWWSPAAEAQAVDRAHRIGQTRPVTVYRLVSQNTIEEKVAALQERKRELFAAVVDDGEMFGSAVTASDIRALLG